MIHFGIIPRTNRGIFAINELPDLPPRIQVGLLNILEERDVQIRGFPVRMPLDVLLVFSANPEDYTNRGNIITPLKDRIASQILTHYPADAGLAAEITAPGGLDRARAVEEVVMPELVRDADRGDRDRGARERARRPELGRLARGWRSRPSSSWSRTSSAAALATGDRAGPSADAAISSMLLPAITGKVELVYEGEQQGTEVVARKLVGQAVKQVFERRFPAVGRASAAANGRTDPYSAHRRLVRAGNAVTRLRRAALRRLRGGARAGARPRGARPPRSAGSREDRPPAELVLGGPAPDT